MEASTPVALSLPSEHSKDHVAGSLEQHDDWFYEFNFSNGAKTVTRNDLVRTIHESKPELIFPFLDHLLQRRWSEIDCLDMACHQGWYSIQTALRGARKVFGVDVREEHVARAELVRDLAGLTNASFEQRNLYDLSPETDGRYDLTLFLGVLYHLADPVGALKIARAMTKELCVIETQVARPADDLEYLWGSDVDPRHGHAVAVGKVGPRHVAGGTDLVLVPTLRALYYMLHAVGFERLYLSIPPASSYDQFRDLDRVVIFASG
jgi:hypothetical protein